jgi:protein O-mannosyl-transferase
MKSGINSRFLAFIPPLIALVIYAQTFNHEYVLDDEDAIVKNVNVQQGVDGISAIWSSEYRSGFSNEKGSLFRPLALTLFALEWELWPNNPVPAHVLNVLLYLLCCWLLFFWLKRLLVDSDPWLLLFISLLFTLHPMHTEVVANIKSADELLALVFSLLALVTTMIYYDTSKKVWGFATLILFFFALSSKEGVITLVAVAPLMLLMFREVDWKRIRISIAPFILAVIGYFALRINALGNLIGGEEIPILDNLLVGLNGFERFTTTIGLAGIYVAKLIFPESLSHDYSIGQFESMVLFDLPALFGFIVFIALIFVSVKTFAKQKIVSFSILFFIVTFSIYSNIVVTIGTHMGDRLMFLPSIGFCAGVGWLFWKWATLKTGVFNWKKMGVAGTFFMLISIMYGVKSFNRAGEWKDELTLYTADVQNAQNSTRTHYRLGLTMNKQGLLAKNDGAKKRWFDSAKKELSLALDIYPDFSDALSEMGLSLQNLGEYDQAQNYNKRALKINPNHVSANNNTGVVFFLQGEIEKAIPYFERSLELNPNYREAAGNLGTCYGTIGEYQKAIKWFKRSVEIEPSHAQSYFFIALTYQNMGEKALSDEWIAKARQIDPNIGK